MVVPGYVDDPNFVDIQAWANTLSASKTEDMLETIQDKASIYKELQFDSGNNKFLFLVTCDYNINNGRMVLAAKRLKKIDENLRS